MDTNKEEEVKSHCPRMQSTELRQGLKVYMTQFFGGFISARDLSSPVTFLTGDHMYKSDLTRSCLWFRQHEIWVRDSEQGNQHT